MKLLGFFAVHQPFDEIEYFSLFRRSNEQVSVVGA